MFDFRFPPGGSPLRGQGTRPSKNLIPPSWRFTPARAGNTDPCPVSLQPLSVHPCAGREHRAARARGVIPAGSPLRGQGTPYGRYSRGQRCRFTPARAGNTANGDLHIQIDAVHPCAGREHVADELIPCKFYHGSPLRGQGTRRFPPSPSRPTTVHPCAGREHLIGQSAFSDTQTVHPCAGREH